MGGSTAKPTDVMNQTNEALVALGNLQKKVVIISNELLEQKYGIPPPTPSDDRVVLFSRKTTLYFAHGYNPSLIENAAKGIMDITLGFEQWAKLTDSIVQLTQSVVAAIVGSGQMTIDGECRAMAFTSGGMRYKSILVINLGDVEADKYLAQTRFQLYDHYFCILELGPANPDNQPDIPIVGPGGVDTGIEIVEKPNGDHDYEITDIEFERGTAIIGKNAQIDRQLNEQLASVNSLFTPVSFVRNGPKGKSFDDLIFE